MKNFHLTIASLDKSVFDGFVTSVSVPGSEGVMTILAQHVPIISPLKSGMVRYVTDDATEHEYPVSGAGTIEVSDAGCTILI